MVPSRALKATLGASSYELIRPRIARLSFWNILGITWAILGAIWCPAGRQEAPKIDLFATKSHQKLKKWIPEWGIKKCMKIWSKFDEKNEILNVLKPQNYYV